jgi:hypothetical protein
MNEEPVRLTLLSILFTAAQCLHKAQVQLRVSAYNAALPSRRITGENEVVTADTQPCITWQVALER